MTRAGLGALSVLLVIVSACEPAGPAPAAPPPKTPVTTPGDPPMASAAEPSADGAVTTKTPAAGEGTGPAGPYEVTASASASASGATNLEDVTVSFDVAGGPRGKGIEPRARVTVEWADIPKAGRGKPAPPTTEMFPPGADICAGAPLDKSVSFPMQTKRNARIRVEVVACREGAVVPETRAAATTSVSWVSPYVDAIEVPPILRAGATTQGTIRFRGIDGPKAAGAPPKVTVTSSNPGVTITKQPTVAASSTFEIAVKPTVTGDVKLTAQHVNTDGQGRILGTITKATTVRVRAP